MLFNLIMFFTRPTLKILKKTQYNDGTQAWDYTFGSKIYRSVGRYPEQPEMGICLPIVKATCDGQDITDEFIRFAGPKYNHVPDTGYILYRRVPTFRVSFPGCLRLQLSFTKDRGPSKDIKVLNIVGQESVFGAK